MRTEVIFMREDTRYGEYRKGDTGYIDGYLSLDNVPYIVVVNNRRKMPCLVMFDGTVIVKILSGEGDG